jgi:hypothetical protein
VNQWSFPKSKIAELSARLGGLLKLDGIVDNAGKPLDGPGVMYAFALTESIHRGDLLDCTPRFEPAYFSGRYSKEKHQAELNALYGPDGAKSYGNWQVMLVNAPGFKPSEFTDPEKGALAFLGYMNRYLAGQANLGRAPRTLGELGDMYNSGNCRDANTVPEYRARLENFYATEVLG